MYLSHALALVLVCQTASARRAKFMPLGDSITEITCWRGYLWEHLSEAGFSEQVDFVGSKDDNLARCKTKFPNMDLDHEGHRGWKASEIVGYLQHWLWSAATPDIVQFMLGTNDIYQGSSSEEILSSYSSMVEIMRRTNPKMQIIVDKLIPLSTNQSDTAALNELIPQWAANLTTKESPIRVADCSKEVGFTVHQLRDGVHPNDEGDQIIAKQIYPVAVEAIQQALADLS